MNAAEATSARIEPRLIYWIDAAGSLILGVALALTAGTLTSLAGWSLPSSFLFWIGLLLVPWAVFNAFIARAARPPSAAIRVNIAGDVIWVGGTLVVMTLEASSLSGPGLILLAGQGVAVGGVLALKLAGARQLLD
jgi:hypothetical protein